jgi:hypothetical protein
MVMREGTALLPVTTFFDRPGHIRPAQICAVSAGEMRGALRHAGRNGHDTVVIVTHSFEMLSRDRLRPNRLVTRRFEAMCRAIAADPRLRTTGIAGLDRARMAAAPVRQERLTASRLRTAIRQAQQALGTWAYERRLTPA